MTQRQRDLAFALAGSIFLWLASGAAAEAPMRPNIVLLMGDDHGWDETGYNGHPHLQTPVLDEMAAAGLRLDRFYSAHPSCSPTRGSVMTGRHPNRYGTFAPNWSIRPEEISVAQVLGQAGYVCGHFGKWHLGPVKASSPTNPGALGFKQWLSHDNFFELNPQFSRNGGPPEPFQGESSEILIEAAIRFIEQCAADDHPFCAVVWFGSPHEPYSGLPQDLARYESLPERYRDQTVKLTSNETGRPTERSLRKVLQERYAEITAMDRAIGRLRQWLDERQLRTNTLLWYCGDNGTPSGGIVTSPFRGQKGTMYEGGIRVPGIMEWPAGISRPRASAVNAVTSDILPTLCDIAGQPLPARPLDGISLKPLLDGAMRERPKPIFFWSFNLNRPEARGRPYLAPELQEGTTPLVKAMAGRLTRNFTNFHHPEIVAGDDGGARVALGNRYKLLIGANDRAELFDLRSDPAEKKNLALVEPDIVAEMRRDLREWQHSVLTSLTGADYQMPAGKPPEQPAEQPAEKPPGRPAAKRGLPNIVYVLADDLGYGDVSCYNPESKIQTPHIDRLAAEGMRFTDAHSPSAVCTPTRYGILTGRYAWRTWLKYRVLDGLDPPLIEDGRLTVPGYLKQHGYATGCVGKWHLGMQWTDRAGQPVPAVPLDRKTRPRGGSDVDYSQAFTGGPTARGFDWYFGIAASLNMPPLCYLQNDRPVRRPTLHQPRIQTEFISLDEGVRSPDFTIHGVMPRLTGEAIGFIERHAESQPDRPFFLYAPLTAPHLPLAPNAEYRGASQAGEYGDFVAETDAFVGAVLETLDHTGLADNTLVIFTSDNGGLYHYWTPREADDLEHYKPSSRGRYVQQFGHRGNAHLRGTKADIWEGGHRVPFVVRWPGRTPRGAVSEALIELTDLLATTAAIVGEPLPPGAGPDSRNALPALLAAQPDTPVREFAVHHSLWGVFAIRRGPWKLIPHRGSGGFTFPKEIDAQKEGGPPGQLYHLTRDPSETRNQWRQQPRVVAELSELLERVRREP